MWIGHFWRALNRADASVVLEAENIRLRAALTRAESDFEVLLDELSDPATVRAIPEVQDGLWRTIRDRCRVGRDEVRAVLDGRTPAKGR